MSAVNKLGICLSWKAQDGLCIIFFFFFFLLFCPKTVQKQTCSTLKGNCGATKQPTDVV